MPQGFLRRMRQALGRFRDNDKGVIAVEAMVALPALLFTFAMMFSFFHMYRAHNDHVRATTAVADLMSRENVPVTAAMVNGMLALQRLSSRAGNDAVWMRVSSLYYDGNQQRFRLVGAAGSRSTNPTLIPALTDNTVHTVAHRLPMASAGDGLILVETWRTYTPPISYNGAGDARIAEKFNEDADATNSGMLAQLFAPRVIREAVVMRPHFLSPLPLN
jgi:Flp pilus assembly protein TadG